MNASGNSQTQTPDGAETDEGKVIIFNAVHLVMEL